jgi:HAD superfamily hydrolase (TIGR01484 family)
LIVIMSFQRECGALWHGRYTRWRPCRTLDADLHVRYHVLAADYDGTIAIHGAVDAPTLAALERVKASGRRVVLVTGRELDEVLEIFPGVEVCDLVVAENGALVYDPRSRHVELLCTAPPESFVSDLRRHGVEPLSVGRAIVATWRPHETTVLDAIQRHGLELHVVFNKTAVMVLPSGINKATGLAAALAKLELSPHNTVAVGDAENDHALLEMCECGVAVANAVPALKERADFVTGGDHGQGVIELVDLLVTTDLANVSARLGRHDLPLGTTTDGAEVRLPAHGASVLIAGTSGGGKTTIASGLLERLAARGYQFLVIDPEGDYGEFDDALCVGDTLHTPPDDEVTALLRTRQNVVVSLLGTRLADRPRHFAGLFARVQEMRARTGRPHWILVDEAHHLLPSAWQPPSGMPDPQGGGVMLVTVHPGQVSPRALSAVDIALAIGAQPDETLALLADATGSPRPDASGVRLRPGDVLVWWRGSDRAPYVVRTIPPQAEHKRHVRKYAAGELLPHEYFFFRGPEGRLKLRVHNLAIFVQIAEGVDDDTWTHHLRRGDYSEWFRRVIKDDGLADDAAEVERDASLSPAEGRLRIREAIEKRYTAPA